MDCTPVYTLWKFAEDIFAAIGMGATFTVALMTCRVALGKVFDRLAE